MEHNAEHWRTYRQKTLNKRYVIHYLTFLEDRREDTKENHDQIEHELATILDAFSQTLRTKKLLRVERFARVLFKTSGVLAKRGYLNELLSYLDKAIIVAKEVDDEFRDKFVHMQLSILNVFDLPISKYYEGNWKAKLREKEVIARSLVAFSIPIDPEEMHHATANNPISRSSEVLFQKIDKKDIPTWFNELTRSNYTQRVIHINQLLRNGNSSEAQKQLSEMLNSINNLNDRSLIIANLVNTSVVSKNISQIDQFLNQALDLAYSLKDYDSVAQIKIKLASLASTRGNYAAARDYISDAQSYFEQAQSRKDLADAIYVSALIEDKFGNTELAVELLHNSLSRYEAIKHYSGMATIFGKLGYVALGRDNFAEAYNFFLQAQSLAKMVKDFLHVAQYDIQLGIIEEENGRFDIAHTFYVRALDSLDNLQNPTVCHGLRRLGHLAERAHNYEAAKQYYEKALNMARAISDDSAEAISILQLSQLLIAMQDNATAERYLSQSIVLYRRIGNSTFERVSLAHLGNLYFKQQKYDLAKIILSQALPLLDDSDPILNTLVHDLLNQIESKLQND